MPAWVWRDVRFFLFLFLFLFYFALPAKQYACMRIRHMHVTMSHHVCCMHAERTLRMPDKPRAKIRQRVCCALYVCAVC